MTTNVNVQEVMSQAIVSAMTVSIMASAMGIMMGAVGAKAYKVPASELKGTQAAVRELRLAFGANVVDRAVKNVGTDSMVALAKEVERLVIENMHAKYGVQATDAALKAAPPGDVAAAMVIASSLAASGLKTSSWDTELESPSSPKVEAVVKTAKRKGKQKRKPVLDTTTNIEYKSKSSAGMAVAAEYGLDPTNTFIWYEVIKKAPTRFKEIGTLTPSAPPESLSLEDAMKKYEKEA